MRAANNVLRCPVCRNVVENEHLFSHLLNSHPFQSVRHGWRAGSPHQRLEAVLGGVLVGLVVLLVLLVLR